MCDGRYVLHKYGKEDTHTPAHHTQTHIRPHAHTHAQCTLTSLHLPIYTNHLTPTNQFTLTILH